MADRALSAPVVRLVAAHVIRQWLRNRLVMVVVSFGAAIVGLSIVLAPLMQIEPDRLVMDLGLSGIESCGLLILLLQTALQYFDEREQQSLSLILVKPVPRWRFICGAFLGQSVALLGMTAVLAAFTWVATRVTGESPLLSTILPAAALLWVELCLLSALCLLFLQLATSMVAAVLYPLGAFVLGQLSGTLGFIAEHSRDSVLRTVLRAVRVLVPRYDLFNLKNEALSAWPGPEFLVPAMGYAAAYVASVLLLTIWLFSRREH